MKITRIALLAIALMLGTTMAAFAAGTPAGAAQNPAQTCGPDNIFIAHFGPYSFELQIPSRGGCASSTAQGELTQAAYIANCKMLRQELPAFLWNMPVAIDPSTTPPTNNGGFGGKIATCAELLKGYHTGTLQHPE